MAVNQKEIEEMVRSITQEEGLEIFELKIDASGRKLIRLSVDYPQGGISLSQCANINKKIIASLSAQDFSLDDYTVEVNSPGLNRPLKTFRDFLKTKGRTVLIWLKEPIEGKTYLEGEVVDLSPEKLFLSLKNKPLEIPFAKIKTGKERIQ